MHVVPGDQHFGFTLHTNTNTNTNNNAESNEDKDIILRVNKVIYLSFIYIYSLKKINLRKD